MGRLKRNSKASAICDRSGFKYPMNEMVLEPGTGWLVHRSMSDGQWSVNRHPLNNLSKYLKGKQGDPFPVENARPRPSTETVNHQNNYSVSVNLNTQYALSATCFVDTIGAATFVCEGALTCSGTVGVGSGFSSGFSSGFY